MLIFLLKLFLNVSNYLESLIHSFLVNAPVLSADLSHNDRYLCIGNSESCLTVIDLKSISVVKTIRIFKKDKPINNIVFGT